ncbi:MAG TPA: glycosyltransferase family 39 protein [Chloroflexota bacterium]|nr:glycosyltransferase family 39 protein [Chloroflexota bacterium]
MNVDRETATLVPERFATRPVLLIAAALFVVEVALSGRYGFHRDELYFLDAARHPQGGYVDQPFLVPLLARVSLSLFGVWLPGLRLWSAIAVAATVVIGALLAREFGGRRNAQLLAALATATMTAVLGAGHLLETTTFDIMFWAALAFVVVRIGRTGDSRYWVLGGLVLGLGLTNKHSAGFFAGAIFIGALLSGGWRYVFNRWALAAAAIAACFTIPDLWWQAQHNWPTIAMTRTLNQENGGYANIVTWVVGQLLMVSLALAWLWVAGIGFLWQSNRPLWRALVWAYVLLFVLFALTTGGKVYYLAGAYVCLLAAGAVRTEAWLADRRRRSWTLLAATTLTTLIVLPVVLPVLPVRDVGGVPTLAEEVGWPELVRSVSNVWFSLPPAQRARAVIFTGDYGEAGAINELGRGTGLPIAVSGHNNEWFWGPGDPHATTVVAVEPGPVDQTSAQAVAYLSQFFRHLRVAATLYNHARIHNQEWGGHIYICTGLRHPWGIMWPRLRQYS